MTLFSGSPSGTRVTAAMATCTQSKSLASLIIQWNNQKAAQYLAVAMAGLIVLFATLHWSRFIYNRYGPKRARNSKVLNATVMVSRSARRILTKGLPGFASYGHLLLVLTYLVINIILTVTNVQWTGLSGIAKRCGWMAITNVAFITFLALKNTPLALLTSYSYERLNPLHQVGGYASVTYALLHLTLMCTSFSRLHLMKVLLGLNQIHGMIGACSAFVMLVTATFIRKMQYEVFYVTHIMMYMLFIINIAMHRPEYGLKVTIITTFAGSIWALDRIVRGCGLLWYSRNNTATLTALSHGGTRVVLRRAPCRAVPGAHCFLWIPKIRAVETHPFTIVSVAPQSLEFVVAAHDGFTKDLHRYAQLHPGAKLTASIDGPYGVLPIFADVADKMVLIAGGSGASFTFGVALDMVRKLGESSKTTIDFIWTVKEHEALSWFFKELAELQSSPLVTLHLYITSQRSCITDAQLPSSSPPSSPVLVSDEKQSYNPISPAMTEKLGFSIDIEKARTLTSSVSPTKITQTTTPWDSTATLTTAYGRPDVDSLIKKVVSKADDWDRVVIAACGPSALMKAVRGTAASAIRVKGPSVELHCEAFGW